MDLIKSLNILDNIEISYFELDLKGNLIYCNDNVCKDFRYTKEELIGMNFKAFMKPESIGIIQSMYNEIYRTGKPKTLVNVELIRKDGTVLIAEESASVLRDPSGQVIGFQGVARDVTNRILAEEELRRSEEKYRTILEIMEIGYFETDLRGVITFVNDAACRLTTSTREKLIGLPYKSYHTPEETNRIYEVFHRVYNTGKPEFLSEYEVRRKGGEVGTHQLNVALLKNGSGEPMGFRILAKDITELKNAEQEKARIEQQLVQAQKMESVGRLAGGVAHDFNNMLTVILGYSELIKSRLPEGSPLLTEILEIEKAAGRSRDLTRQLLAFSRKEIISPRIVDLNGLILSAQKTLSRLIGEDVDLKFFPGTNLWKIKFDPSQLEHLLMNLAANARDAMPQGGKLTIETENIRLNESYCRLHPGFLPGYYVLLGVSDNGIGMKKATVQHLFEPFFTTKEPSKGTGLGLATVYGIVKQNEGFINVYSEPGRGTTFKIYIPRSKEETPAREEALEPVPAIGSGTLVLVEDDEMVRAMTSEMLEALGYTVITTGNPIEALSYFERNDPPIDLMITDVVMPEMSGKELSKKVEAIRPGTRVLFMSGYTTNVIAHRGVLDKGVYFIQKPFSMSDLAARVSEAISGK